MRNLAALVLVLAALCACGADPLPSCGAPGLARSCPCPGGAQGAQECGPGGAWEACVCATPDAAPDAAADAVAPPDGPRDAPAEASACPAGWGECSPGACVNLASTAAHCGACGYACPSHARCERGECRSPSGLSCEMGRGDCDNNVGSGCEAQFRADHANCGACGNDCRARGLFCREGACAP